MQKFWTLTLFSLLVIGLVSFGLVSCGKRSEQTSVDTTQHVEIIPAPESKYPDVKLTIVSPREGQELKDVKDSVLVVMQVSGTELGVHTDNDSTKGIAYSKQGQHVHVIVDDKPYMANYKNGQPFNIGVLTPGMHTLRAFPSFSWHESIKSPGAFATRTFYVGTATHTNSANNLSGPLLTYSRPKGEYSVADAAKVLLDFYISNAELGPNSYKVRPWIDGKQLQDITKWQAYYITGLGPGTHNIKLQLIAPDGSVVPGPYNSPSTEITIK